MILSIDIGYKGSIVFYSTADDKIIKFVKAPTQKHTLKTLRKGKRVVRTQYNVQEVYRQVKPYIPAKIIDTVLIEDVHPVVKQGLISTGSLMFGRGMYEMLAAALSAKLIAIDPRGWKKYFGLLRTEKEASIKKFIQLFDEHKIKLSSEIECDQIKLWDGLTDAALMAYFYNHSSFFKEV